MFRRPQNTDTLWQARVDDLKEAHEREIKALRLMIDALAEQIDYLRVQLNQSPRAREAIPGLAESPMVEDGLPLFLTEEEEEAIALRQAGLISEADLERIQQGLNEQFLGDRALSIQ